jgi:hypothetical protein
MGDYMNLIPTNDLLDVGTSIAWAGDYMNLIPTNELLDVRHVHSMGDYMNLIPLMFKM